MAIRIPLTNDGAQQFQCQTPAGFLTFLVYYQPIDALWLMDISDSNGNTIIQGLALLAGSADLLHGAAYGTVLDGYRLTVYVGQANGDRGVAPWGNTGGLVLFSPIDPVDPSLIPSDPMLNTDFTGYGH
jgi:hypothetical protein